MKELIAQIDAFRKLHGISESGFGIAALNDKNFLPELRAGRDLRFSTAEKCKAFMAEYKQDAAA